MEVLAPRPACHACSILQRDWALLALLVLLAGGIHAWMLQNTAVAARDSLGHVRYAWQLERRPWIEVMQGEQHPPLYPLSVLAVSIPLRHIVHTCDSLTMQYSAQLASTIAGILLVIPMFCIGKELFDRRVGFWSALLFHCLPTGSRAVSDGLTEGLYLLLAATLFLWVLRGLRSGSPFLLGLAGLCGGLAYLTRPEGGLLVAAAGLVLLAMQLRRAWRQPAPRVLAGAVCLALGALIVSVPYMLVIGGLSKKTTHKWITLSTVSDASNEDDTPEAKKAEDRSSRGAQVRRAGHLPLAVIFAAWADGWSEGAHQGNLLWGIGQWLKELGKSFHYVLWLPMLLGLCWFRERFAVLPGLWVMLLVCLILTGVLWRMTVVAGYVSERHCLIYVLCGLPWAVAGVQELVRRGALYCGLPADRLRAVTVLVLSALALAGLPSTLKALHPSRAGFREAGLWLAEHADPDADLLDPFSWTHYYSGRAFSDPWPPPLTRKFDGGYVVLDNLYSGDHHSHLPVLPRAKKLAETGRLVYRWPTNASERDALVFIYANCKPE